MSSTKLSGTAGLAPSLPAVRAAPRTAVVSAAKVVGVILACFVAQWVAVRLWVPPAAVSTVWIPGGLMLAIALLTESRRWPVIMPAAAGGTTLLFLTLGLVRPAGAVLLGLLAGLHTVGLATLVRMALPRPLAFATLREFLIYLVVVVVGGAGIASILFLAGAGGLAIRPATFLVWRTFALAAVLGYLLMTPTVVLLVREARAHTALAPGRGLEAGLLSVLLALACALVFIEASASRAATWTAFAITLPPLLLWSAMRFGALGAAASLLFVTVFSTWSTGQGWGPFTGQSPADNTLALQLLMLGTGFPLLGLAVVLGEQRRITTALRSSEARLKELNVQLVAAREDEAMRIGRELHDDVGQRLALVSIGLSRLRQAQANPASSPHPDLRQLQEQTSAIAQALREISHQLYPAALEQVGLSSALQLKCEEVQQATGLELRMANHGDTAAIPRDVALCLFRVAQEALNNVTRHSGAHHVGLWLRREPNELQLQVTDDGRGFVPGAPEHACGLGLHSAAERVGSVGGTLTVESVPGAGTTLRVAIPVRESDDASATGHPRG